MTSLFPIFVKLESREVLVVGAGSAGESKIGSLLGTGAKIRVVARQASAKVQMLADSGEITLQQRGFELSDLDGAFLVVVATNERDLNEIVFREAQKRGILANVVDVPELCDFFYPAVVRRGDLQIAISTSGQSPSLAKKLRQDLERQYGEGYAQWVRELGETRRMILASDLEPARKKDLLSSFASREAAQAEIGTHRSRNMKGEVA